MSAGTMKLAALALLAASLLMFPLSLFAQDQGAGQDSQIDFDSLFGGDVVESPQDQPAASAAQSPAALDPVAEALRGLPMRVGGSFSGSLGVQAQWDDLWNGTSAISSPDSSGLTDSLKGSIFFDARPAEDFRVHGSVKLSWPFDSASLVNVFDLFADFSMNDKAYIRFGKSTVKWGVGYFWSPADVINLESINAFDATAQREGPVNLRVQLPIPNSQNNVYLYAILDEKDVAFDTTALAARAEFMLRSFELGIGGYYRRDTAERAMLTLTGPVGNVDVFGEAMVSRGSAKTFVTDILSSPPYTITTSGPADNRGNFYFSASTGFLYSSPKDQLTAIGQYYYNGEGYADSSREGLISDAQAAAAALTLAGQPDTAALYIKALAGLILGSGQHYGALSLSKGGVFTDDLSVSLIGIANFSDFSGIVKPTITWAVHDNFKLSASPTFVFGKATAEYALLAGGNIVSVSVGGTISGSF